MPTKEQMEKLRILHEQEIPVPAIASQMEVYPSTIYRWLKDIPKREPRIPKEKLQRMEHHQSYVNRRISEGETNVNTLLKEIKERGYDGSKKTLGNYISRTLRENPAPKQHQEGAATTPDAGQKQDSKPAPGESPEEKTEGTEEQNHPTASSHRVRNGHILLTEQCTDDLGALAAPGGRQTLEVRFTPLGTIYATMQQNGHNHSKSFSLGHLDPDIFPRDRAIELLATSRPTTLSELKTDIDSLKDLFGSMNPGNYAAPDVSTETEAQPAEEQTADPATNEPDEEANPEVKQGPQPADQDGQPDTAEVEGHLKTQEQNCEVNDDAGAETTAEENRPAGPELPENAETQPGRELPTIADAWGNLNSETPIHPQHLERILSTVVKEITSAAGKLLPSTSNRVDLGKGFHIAKDPQNLQAVITHQSPAGTRKGLLAPISDVHGTGIRDAQFHAHTHWWEPADGDRLKWLESKLREQATRFIMQSH